MLRSRAERWRPCSRGSRADQGLYSFLVCRGGSACFLHAFDLQGLANGIGRCVFGVSGRAGRKTSPTCSAAPSPESSPCVEPREWNQELVRHQPHYRIQKYILIIDPFEKIQNSRSPSTVFDQGASARSGMPITSESCPTSWRSRLRRCCLSNPTMKQIVNAKPCTISKTGGTRPVLVAAKRAREKDFSPHPTLYFARRSCAPFLKLPDFSPYFKQRLSSPERTNRRNGLLRRRNHDQLRGAVGPRERVRRGRD